MKHRILILLMVLMDATASLMAQNRIDKLVDNYSTNTTSKYTSAVERNPKNRAVVKVVKVLEISYADITPFAKAFKQEAESGDFTERKDGNTLIMMLTSRGTTQNRIYMLKADNYYREHGGHNTHAKCNITTIIKYK